MVLLNQRLGCFVGVSSASMAIVKNWFNQFQRCHVKDNADRTERITWQNSPFRIG